MATAVKIEKLDITKLNRNKCLAWDANANKGKGAGVYTDDLLNDDGTVNVDACKQHGVEPKDVKRLTVADLPADYRKDYRSAITAYAKEVSMTAEDAVWELILGEMLQRAANKSVAAVRPTTDRSKDRAISVMRKLMQAQGKSEAQINAALAALGVE